MVESGSAIAHVEEVPVVRMGEFDDVPSEFDRLGVRHVDDEALATEEMKVKIWHVPPGDRMGSHGHRTQEEFYYVLAGEFEVVLGRPGETERHRAEPGTAFAASPGVARGYENIGDEEGRVLVVAAPAVPEPGIPESELGE